MANYQLIKKFEDETRRKNKGFFKVNPNKAIHPYNKELYPLTFTGFLNSSQIKIILNNADSMTVESYDFVNFPENESIDYEDVVEWIHQFINKKMD